MMLSAFYRDREFIESGECCIYLEEKLRQEKTNRLGSCEIGLFPFSRAQDDRSIKQRRLGLWRCYAHADCNVAAVVIAIRYVSSRSDCEFAFNRRVLINVEGH
jgi:hypothetical protein